MDLSIELSLDLRSLFRDTSSRRGGDTLRRRCGVVGRRRSPWVPDLPRTRPNEGTCVVCTTRAD